MSIFYDESYHNMLCQAFGERLMVLLGAHDFPENDVMPLEFNHAGKTSPHDYNLIIVHDASPACRQFINNLDDIEGLGMFLVEDEENMISLAWTDINKLCRFFASLEAAAEEIYRHREKPPIVQYINDADVLKMLKKNNELLYFTNNSAGYVSLSHLFKETMEETVRFGGACMTHTLDHILAAAQWHQISSRPRHGATPSVKTV